MKVKKSLVALSLASAMFAGSAMAATTSGQNIGTGTMNVSGTIGSSTCMVTFPTSVVIPAISSADYDNTAYGQQISEVNAGNIQFQGCDGQSVAINVSATGGTVHQAGTYMLPQIDGQTQSYLGLTLDVGDNQSVKLNGPDDRLSSLSISSGNNSFPVTVRTLRAASSNITSNTLTGAYSASFVFTATYA